MLALDSGVSILKLSEWGSHCSAGAVFTLRLKIVTTLFVLLLDLIRLGDGFACLLAIIFSHLISFVGHSTQGALTIGSSSDSFLGTLPFARIILRLSRIVLVQNFKHL